ncbi:MAG: rod shape-determining protein MreC [Candidatus Moraniibacteriota bacterium]
MNPKGLPHSKLFRAIIVLMVLLGFAAWSPSPVGIFARGTFHTVFLPAEQLFSWASFGLRDAMEFLSSVGDLKYENERLTEENMRLQAENARFAFVRDEDESLRKSVGLEIRKRFDLLATEVVASGGEGGRGSVVISRGSMQGVSVGMAAVVGEGVLVGVVDEVYPASAKVALVTNSESALGGITLGNGSQGIVRGDRGLGISYGNVLQSNPLAQGDQVVTSGVGGTVPSGLLLGTVSSVRDSGDRLFREASILSPVDFGKLRFLFLIRNGLAQ